MLGVTEYYQKCIPAYADTVSPPTQLICKIIPFIWTSQCQNDFKTL